MKDTLRTGPELIVGFIPTFRAENIVAALDAPSNDDLNSAPPILNKGESAGPKHDEAWLKGLTAVGVAAIAATLVDTEAIIEKWNKSKLAKVGQRYIAAVNTPEVLWSLLASQLLSHTFPDLPLANSQLSIMDSESRFDVDVLHPSKAYGLMQIIPSNVKHIAAFPLSEKIMIAKEIAPVIDWVQTIDPVVAEQMRTGQWPDKLTTAYPIWQIPYIAVLWREAMRDLKASFKWDGHQWTAKTSGKRPVVNSNWLTYMKENPAIFSDFETGRTAILANLWKHGAPRGLYKDEPLTYLHEGVDHITPVVEAFTNLESHPTLPAIVKSLIIESKKAVPSSDSLLDILKEEAKKQFSPGALFDVF